MKITIPATASMRVVEIIANDETMRNPSLNGATVEIEFGDHLNIDEIDEIDGAQLLAKISRVLRELPASTNPQAFTESHYGLDADDMPDFDDDLVSDVEAWLERPMTEGEIERLKELCRK